MQQGLGWIGQIQASISSLVEGDDGSYLPNCQTNLVIALHALSLLFWHFINTTAYHLGWYEPSSPCSKSLFLNSQMLIQIMRRLLQTPQWIASMQRQDIKEFFATTKRQPHAAAKNKVSWAGPWSSGYGMSLMFWRPWVWIPAPYTGWTFFTLFCF